MSVVSPYPVPSPDAPLRLAFVGQQTYFRASALDEHSTRAQTRFVEFRAGGDGARLRAEIDAFGPHAVVCFRPEILPAGVFADLRVPVLGFLTEPIVRRVAAAGGHWDLLARRRDMDAMDTGNVDRIVSFDPLIVDTADEVMDVWRSLPIPVADRLYRPVPARPDPSRPARMLFVGRSTVHRERWLMDVKHRYDALHVAFGAGVEELEGLLDTHDVTFNVHNEPYPTFENRVLIHLAAGHLVITEPLSPTHGLEPGLDYLEVAFPEELSEFAGLARAFPDSWHRIRVRGRAKAELHRASRVWPALIRDLRLDLAAFGTHRPAAR